MPAFRYAGIGYSEYPYSKPNVWWKSLLPIHNPLSGSDFPVGKTKISFPLTTDFPNLTNLYFPPKAISPKPLTSVSEPNASEVVLSLTDLYRAAPMNPVNSSVNP